MNIFKTVFACVLVLLVALPVFAQEEEGDEFMFEWTQMRYRFDHEVNVLDASGDMAEYFDDDFDTEFTFTKGDVKMFFGVEIADTNLGGDIDPQDSYASALGDYGAIWTPEALADSSFQLQVGEFNGMSFGNLINNDDGNHGTIVASWKMGEIGMALGYSKLFEGDTNDDVEGDEHQFRAKVSMPIGEAFEIGGYVAFHSSADMLLQAAVEGDETTPGVPAVMGDGSLVLGAVNFSGTAGNVSLYSEAGFASGTRDVLGADAAVEQDTSGFYVMGSADMTVGEITLGVAGGFSPGDDDPTDDKDEGFTAVNSDFWIGQIMHDEELITRTNGSGGGLSNIIYAQLTAAMSPSDKIDLDAGIVYLAPVEEVNGADTYGIELFGGASYALADSVSYNFYWGVAMPDEDFIDETLYQFTNRLEFDIK
jgi:hypothetical protein